MKRVTKMLLLGLLVGTAATSFVYAQDRPEKGDRAERLDAVMTEKLALDQNQQTAVADINARFRQQARAARTTHADNRPATRQAVRALNQRREAELKEVLTSDQWTRYGQLKSEWQEQRRQRRGAPGQKG